MFTSTKYPFMMNSLNKKKKSTNAYTNDAVIINAHEKFTKRLDAIDDRLMNISSKFKTKSS